MTLFLFQLIACTQQQSKCSNILFAISDDQSFDHTSFAGCNFTNTPAFDRVVAEGIEFPNCNTGSPGCAPSRSTIVTGRYHWQNEYAGQHASSWMKAYIPFLSICAMLTDIYWRTGKGVSPFRYARSENDSFWRTTDAGGIDHCNIRYESDTPRDERPAKGIGNFNCF